MENESKVYELSDIFIETMRRNINKKTEDKQEQEKELYVSLVSLVLEEYVKTDNKNLNIKLNNEVIKNFKEDPKLGTQKLNGIEVDLDSFLQVSGISGKNETTTLTFTTNNIKDFLKTKKTENSKTKKTSKDKAPV